MIGMLPRMLRLQEIVVIRIRLQPNHRDRNLAKLGSGFDPAILKFVPVPCYVV